MSKILPSLVLLALIPNAAVAQITPDSSLGAENSLVDSNGDRDTIEGGAIRDTNLFHSFQEFNVGAGREAYFANPNGIVNIFSRVTGNNLSNILGTLGVLGDANLFFMNPNGIVFGANARLDVRGSFLGSTADSLVFENGFEFSASNPQAPPLLTVNIPIGLGFRNNPADIVNQSVANNGNGLEVSVGENITLVGGNVDLDGGKIFAGGGRVELGGLSAAGEIGINADGSLSFPEGIERADVTLTNAASVTVRAGGGGSITVNARNVELSGGESGRSFLLAGIAPDSVSSEARAGDITLNATDTISVSQGSVIANVVGTPADTGVAVGNAGGIDITTANLFLIQGGQVTATTGAQGDAGVITIEASDTISVDGESQDGASSGISSGVFDTGVGNAGGIDITTANLFLTRGGQVNTSTFGQGDAGAITIEASETISADGEDQNGFSSGIFSGVGEPGVGNAGGIDITTANLSLTQGGVVNASTFGRGDAGAITIKASGTIFVDGEDQDGIPSGIFSAIGGPVEGNAGDINITTANLSLTQGGVVNAVTLGQGNAGKITIEASGTISVDGEGQDGASSGIFSAAGDTGDGDAADIKIDTNNLSLTNDAEISVQSLGQGTAGDLDIQANSIALENGASLFASTPVDTGGNITLEIDDSLTLQDNSSISAQAFGNANGGNIDIDTTFLIAFPPKSPEGSDIIASADRGDGGNINITAQGIFGIEEREVSEGNQTNDIDASSQFGLAGVVEINQPDVDPSQGLVELPETVVDPKALVAQNPCKLGSESEFVITGRGGLPPSLNEDLSSEATQVGLVEPAPMEVEEQESRGAEDKTSSSPSVPTTIIPAQGWVFNERGEIILVAYDPTITGSQRLKENSTSCPTSGRN